MILSVSVCLSVCLRVEDQQRVAGDVDVTKFRHIQLDQTRRPGQCVGDTDTQSGKLTDDKDRYDSD